MAEPLAGGQLGNFQQYRLPGPHAGPLHLSQPLKKTPSDSPAGQRPLGLLTHSPDLEEPFQAYTVTHLQIPAFLPLSGNKSLFLLLHLNLLSPFSPALSLSLLPHGEDRKGL